LERVKPQVSLFLLVFRSFLVTFWFTVRAGWSCEGERGLMWWKERSWERAAWLQSKFCLPFHLSAWLCYVLLEEGSIIVFLHCFVVPVSSLFESSLSWLKLQRRQMRCVWSCQKPR
jgi:hypothetical protein